MKIGFASLIGVEPMPFADLVRWAGTNGLEAIEVNVGPTFPAIDGARFDFLRGVVEGRPPAVTGAAARTSLELILGIYESSRTGRPVRLPLAR